MASSGPNSPGTMADVDYLGSDDWVNVNNATASDNVYATFTDNGIVAEFERKANSAAGGGSGARINDQEVKLVKAGTIQTTNKSAGAMWSTTEAYVSFGGVADLWSGTWTPSDINNSGFGAVIRVAGNRSDGSETASVDHIRITVYYTAAAGGTTNVAALISCI